MSDTATTTQTQGDTTTQTTQTTQQQTQTQAQAAWYDNFQNAELRGWVQAAGIPDAEQSAAKAWNLEKLMGADRAGRTVVLPSPADQSNPEAWAPVYDKLGRPATPEAYKLPLPEGADLAFSKVAAGWMHKAGLSQAQAQNVAQAWNEYQAKAIADAATAKQSALAAEHAQLDKDWGTGDAAAVQRDLAKRAAAALGLDEAGITALEKVAGFSKTMKAFAKVGAMLQESKAEGFGEGGSSFAMTPEAATAQRARYMADPDFRKRYVAGDHKARADMEAVDKIIAAAKDASEATRR